MWLTVVVLAFAISLEPARPTLVPIMLTRPRAIAQLLAFLAGNFGAGLAAGLPVLLVFHHTPMLGLKGDGAKVQLGVGVLLLVIGGLMASTLSWAKIKSAVHVRTPVGGMAEGEEPRQRAVDRASERARAFLERSNSPWLSAALGVIAGLPSIDYLAAWVVIATSGASPPAQAGALVLFLVVCNTVVIIPLCTYLLAPERTRVWIRRFHIWVRARSRRKFGAMIAAIGVLQIVIGLVRL
jgi:hypothetical protein